MSRRNNDFEDEDCSRGDVEVNEEEDEPEDPMEQLVESTCDFATPIKKKPFKKKQPQRTGVRMIDMPQRPPCTSDGTGATTKVHIFVRPNTKALWIRMDCLNWLVSYGADEHHYQGISRDDTSTSQPADDYEMKFDFNTKAYKCTVNVGIDAGMTLSMTVETLTKDMFEKPAETSEFDECWSKADESTKRRAIREYLNWWCEATVKGSRSEFEQEWPFIPSAKKTQD